MLCPACGDPSNDAAARFCEACGAGLGETPGAASPAPDVTPDAPAVPEHEEAVDASLAVASDRGRRHDTNQDWGSVARRPDGAILLVVADGVSSAENAEEASRAAVGAARAAFLDGAALVPLEAARRCVEAAARAVLDVPRPLGDPALDPPETTIVLAVVAEQRVGLAWVGDSRAYVMSGTGGRQVAESLLTEDDSWAWEAVERGLMSREAAARDPRAHAILQCLGLPIEEIAIHATERAIAPGAALLLCTDGLWNYFDEPGELGALHAQASALASADAALICRRLVAAANQAGGRDNITAAVLLG